MKFTPHVAGSKKKVATYDTVKDYVLNYIQRSYKHGVDVVKEIEETLDTVDVNDIVFNEPKPERKVVDVSKYAMTLSEVERSKVLIGLEQGGYDLEYAQEIRDYNDRANAFDGNVYKAYSYIWSCCSTTMQSRIEEMSNFNMEIKDKPVALLREIKRKMYVSARAKYDYVILTETLNQLLTCNQEENEGVSEYIKRLKQTKDNVVE